MREHLEMKRSFAKSWESKRRRRRAQGAKREVVPVGRSVLGAANSSTVPLVGTYVSLSVLSLAVPPFAKNFNNPA